MKPLPMPVLFSVLLFAAAGVSTAARADDVHCPPHLGRVTIDGNVLVAAACRLEGTIVKGNVLLYAGGSLIVRDDVRIDGSIQAENADFIDVAGARVNGNIQLDNLVGDRSVVDGTSVGGSIQLKNNRSRLEVLDNTVIGDVQAFSNMGGVLIADNEIDGNLQCKSNEPAPVGGNNRVQGNKEDQCANLLPESNASGIVDGTTAAATQSSEASASTADGSSGGGGDFGLFALLALAPLLTLRGHLRWRASRAS
jgi:cytoskeletal protein CcmA (bactofilin family)